MTQGNSISQDRFVHADSIDAVIQTYEECCEENWDGYGSLAVSPAVLFKAIRFICALPQRLPSPEIVPEPAGEIGFEWIYGNNRTFVASVSGTKLIDYAGLLGLGEKFTVPKRVMARFHRCSSGTSHEFPMCHKLG